MEAVMVIVPIVAAFMVLYLIETAIKNQTDVLWAIHTEFKRMNDLAEKYHVENKIGWQYIVPDALSNPLSKEKPT